MSTLYELEQKAQEGIIAFAEAMQEIRDGKLYPGAKSKSDAWADYCKEQWGLSRRHVEQSIQALPVLKRVADAPDGQLPSVTAAASVASLDDQELADEILASSKTRDDAKAKASAVRKKQEEAKKQGRTASKKELRAAAKKAKVPRKTKKERKENPRVTWLGDAQVAMAHLHDDLKADPLIDDVTADLLWNGLDVIDELSEQTRKYVPRPTTVRDLDSEAASILNPDGE